MLLLHVIEHVLDPFEELSAIAGVLRPRGILVIETPRFDTVWFKLLKGRERSIIPGHCHFFTRRTLRQIVEKTGMEVVRLDSVGRSLTLDRLCYALAKVANIRQAEMFSKRFLPLHLNSGTVTLKNLRQEIIIYFIRRIS